ncbi:MAG: UDP-4-amino-4,6-dideoxy-N-acetyl-beta-L-altrosamine transaminase, partial [Sphingobacteriaceae bacterium]|nr:UDP-4-amino-4,6-dideoxy-N-acetyl-beta-L-altrosamine transaminase [Cytophagaceae bacterium]
DLAAVTDTLRSEYLTQGPQIQKFEEAFAAYVGSRYAVAVANGTAALHLCALALGVKPGQKVITTPITFAASANCIRYCGGEVEFTDIDPATGLIDLNRLRDLLEKTPRGTYAGLVPVDFAGCPVNLELARELADEFGLWIIEDACHAPGGAFRDRSGTWQSCGNGVFADLAIFSFHPVKHIACGEGGMVTTNNPELYEELLLLRTHGITRSAARLLENHGGWYYEMQELGYNYRLSDVQAALGTSQLTRAEAGLNRRRELAARYDEAFAGSPVQPLTVPDDVAHAYHLYVVRVEDRKELYESLRSQQIFAQVHYIPVHTMPYYRQFGWQAGDLPEAEAYYAECLSLPMFPSLRDDEQARVIESVLEFVTVTNPR